MPQREFFYSDEAQTIMGKTPSWIVRWGIVIMSIIFIGIFLGCYFIKYPETIKVPVIIASTNPPVDITASSNGIIDTIYVSDGQEIEKGETIARLCNNANFNDVERVSEYLSASETLSTKEPLNASWLNKRYKLGQLQSAFTDFRIKYQDYQQCLVRGRFTQREQLLLLQIAKYKEYHNKIEHQCSLLNLYPDYDLQTFKHNTPPLLEKSTDSTTFDLIAKQYCKAGIETNLLYTELQIIELERQYEELKCEMEAKITKAELDLKKSKLQFANQIALWYQQNVLVASVAGHITFTNKGRIKQHISIKDKIASIIPYEKAGVICQLQIPSVDYGKVHVGQAVFLKLNGYPYMEFGVLTGQIYKISQIPEQVQLQMGTATFYTAEVIFPHGMITTNNREIPIVQYMDGYAEVIVRDLRLIELIFCNRHDWF